MRNVYLTKRQQRESLKATKAQLEIEKNYSIRVLNFIYTFLISIFQQFFYHDFPKTHQTTTHRKIYKNCLVCDTCIRELMVLDVPPQVSRDWDAKTTIQKLNSYVIQLKVYAENFHCRKIWCKISIYVNINFVTKRKTIFVQRTLIFHCISPAALGFCCGC